MSFADTDAMWRSVPVTITDGPAEPEVKTLPKHKKNPEVGEKQTVFSAQVFVEQEDALSFEDQEEVRVSSFTMNVILILCVTHRSR